MEAPYETMIVELTRSVEKWSWPPLKPADPELVDQILGGFEERDHTYQNSVFSILLAARIVILAVGLMAIYRAYRKGKPGKLAAGNSSQVVLILESLLRTHF